MGTLIDEYPSLADGLNEKGLACTVLDLPQYTYWSKEMAQLGFKVIFHLLQGS